MAIYGYARVSTRDQTFSSQQVQLADAGCQHVFSDTISGARSQRPGLTQLFNELKPGDLIVVTRLDRLGRSVSDLIELMREIERKGANLRSLAETIDTTTTTGRLVFHVFAAIAEFERELIRERTMRGLDAARASGSQPGRRPILSREKVLRGEELANAGKLTQSEIARALGVSVSTWRRARKQRSNK